MSAHNWASSRKRTLSANWASRITATSGELGSFEATTKDDAEGMIVVHNYPDTSKYALGSTKLEYVGPKRLGNVDGWVFKTEWDGDRYPSRIFFSSEEVYFGGGESAFIASDYRDSTGWVWKLLPLRRTQLVQDSEFAIVRLEVTDLLHDKPLPKTSLGRQHPPAGVGFSLVCRTALLSIRWPHAAALDASGWVVRMASSGAWIGPTLVTDRSDRSTVDCPRLPNA